MKLNHSVISTHLVLIQCYLGLVGCKVPLRDSNCLSFTSVGWVDVEEGPIGIIVST